MEQTYYRLACLPDLSLSKYSSLDETGVDGVLKHHATFWRQMHRRGLMAWDSFHLFYQYDPARPEGHKLEIGIRFDTGDAADAAFVQQTVDSSPLSAFYGLQRFDPDEPGAPGPDVQRVYRYSAHLVKKENFSRPLEQTDDTLYYTASEWEMNEDARLYNMARLMGAIDRPCLYCASVYPRDLTGTMTQNLDYILPQLRQATKARINARQGNVGLQDKDENANTTLKYYEDLLDDLAENPHFLVDVQVMSDNVNHAAYILDAAAAEALETGAHDLRCYTGDTSLSMVRGDGFISCADERAPEVLKDLPHLFLLEEMVPFGILPALYPGEWIEKPKETAPDANPGGLLLGTDLQGHAVYFPYKNLSKHAFLAGVPGSGKTNSMMHLISAMHRDPNGSIPVLVLEPAKHEYRTLTGVPGMEDLELFSPSASTRFPLHINPFEFPAGMTLAEHIRNLIAVFDGAFALEPPMPFLLDSSVDEVYRDHNWVPAMINSKQLSQKLGYPTMSELYAKLEEKLEKTDYAPEIRGNLKSALQVRIGSLLTREMGDIFDVPYSTVPPEDWLTRSAVIELESMGKDPANFTTLLIATLIRETLKIKNYHPGPDGRPRHVMFLEEAHNLIGPTAEPKGQQDADPKTAATAYIVKMLAEVRALGEGIVIADQLPTAMAPEVIKNTSLKIALRITAQDDRELLGGTMNAGGDQLEKLSIFTPGHALISYEPLLKPFEVQIPYFEAKEGELSDAAILENMLAMPHYLANVARSLAISGEKWDRRKRDMQRDEQALRAVYQRRTELLEQADRLTAAGQQPSVELRAALKKADFEGKEGWQALLKQSADLVVSVMAYQAPYRFLMVIKRPDLPLLRQVQAGLMARIRQSVADHRALCERCTASSGLPVATSKWAQKLADRKDILLAQGVVFDNLG